MLNGRLDSALISCLQKKENNIYILTILLFYLKFPNHLVATPKKKIQNLIEFNQLIMGLNVFINYKT